MIATGEAIEVGPELVLTAPAYAQARASVRDFLAQRGAAPVSELKQAVGATRRVMVPLLERLDRDGLTVREGDLRRLRAAR